MWGVVEQHALHTQTYTLLLSCLQHFDFPLPSPLRVFEMVVSPRQDYPLVCIGVSRGSNPNQPVNVEYINLNSNTSWFTSTGLGRLILHHWYDDSEEFRDTTLGYEFGCFLAEKPCPDVVQVNQLDSSSLLVLIESKKHESDINISSLCHCVANIRSVRVLVISYSNM